MAPTFDVISVVVADMGKSLAFYRTLGLDIPADADDQPHVEHTSVGGFRLCWDTVATIESFHPGFTLSSGPSRMGLAFRCESPAEVDSVYARLIKAGYESELEPFDALWGQRYATVLDPDGNGVDLYCALPTAA